MQVSFHGNRSGSYRPTLQMVQSNSPARSEPISLAMLDRDCFIIPLAALERFLPAGVPVCTRELYRQNCLLVHNYIKNIIIKFLCKKLTTCEYWFQRLPSVDKKRPGSPLSVLEVEDPKQCILAHFMTSMEPLDPVVESPVARPLVVQRDTAAELLTELAPSATQSILLTNMERGGKMFTLRWNYKVWAKFGPCDCQN